MAQALNAFVNPVIIKADALLDGFVYAQPIGIFKAGFGFLASFAKQQVMFVEALDQGECNLMGIIAIEANRDFH